MALFRDPGAFVDICDLLKYLSKLCPQDLLAILALLSQYLNKINLDIKFNIDFIIQLMGPILSPFLDQISQWLDKWVQLLLGPMICVLDHINETIYLTQQFKIPLQNVSGSMTADINGALPFNKNVASSLGGGFSETLLGPKSAEKGDTWGGASLKEFDTPWSQRYNPDAPSYPAEEAQMAAQEISEAWAPEMDEFEREEKNKRWQELKAKDQVRATKVPAPLKTPKADGTRWSKDDVPGSQKSVSGEKSWQSGSYHPPEKQDKPKEAKDYMLNADMIVNSVIQLRNIMQGAIQYVRDWFTYVTQMLYDLLGTDIGWMMKKTGNTILKSSLIRIIMMVKALIEAIAKNGLECGTNNNFSPAQMKFVLENVLNETSPMYKFESQPDGSFKVLSKNDPSSTRPSTTDNSATAQATSTLGSQQVAGLTPGATLAVASSFGEQKSVESGIIIKDCFKDTSKDDLAKVREWIKDFENRGLVGA
jgi:hypothetical protein